MRKGVLVDFSDEHSHQTKYEDEMSALKSRSGQPSDQRRTLLRCKWF